jgi:hypothetical protein
MRDTISNDDSLGKGDSSKLVSLQREAAFDHNAFRAERAEALAIDHDLDASGITDPQTSVFSVERAVCPGRKRTLHANIAVNDHPNP